MGAKTYKFSSLLVKGPFNRTYADFPFDSQKELGTGKVMPVKVTIAGKNFSSNLIPNGKGGHWLQLRKEIRESTDLKEGDWAEFFVQPDPGEKIVEIPDYVLWLLNEDTEMKNRFERLSYSVKKFWMAHIKAAKGMDAKVNRINRFFEFLQRRQ